jgi:hypothetical protein
MLKLVDAKPLDFRFQGLAWNTELRGGSRRSRDPATGFGKCRLDHFDFTF